MDKRYRFTSEKDTTQLPRLSSRICNIIDGFPQDYGEQTALVYGRLKKLFGQPLHETENLEEQYSYCISATAEDGETVCLNVYSGASGPAIGGAQNEASSEAAAALVAFIRQAEPADFEYTGYYMDAPARIWMSVKNGVPYYRQELLDMPEDEWSALYRRLYGLDM